jgi:hypothetical protein
VCKWEALSFQYWVGWGEGRRARKRMLLCHFSIGFSCAKGCFEHGLVNISLNGYGQCETTEWREFISPPPQKKRGGKVDVEDQLYLKETPSNRSCLVEVQG